MIRKFIVLCAILFTGIFAIDAYEKLNLKEIADGDLSPEYLRKVTPLSGTDEYAQISADGGKVVAYSFKTGKQTTVLFDINNHVGDNINAFDGYIMSPNGKQMLIQTNTVPVYRRSFKAEFYIYTIANKKLERLSYGGLQQVPTWSPDGKRVAFVRDNNIFLVKLSPKGNQEEQITSDGKVNEVINGIPDWVNEEEFSFNKALTFNTDGTKICWVKYDESQVETYSLQLFKGSNPALEQFATYPGMYSYKYPKTGEPNSKVSVWIYDIKSKETKKLSVPLDEDGYIPRIRPTADANKIIVCTLNRHQDMFNLYSVEINNGEANLLINEKSDKYIKEETYDWLFVGKKYIVIPSDRDGYMHLYIYDTNGKPLWKEGAKNIDITDFYGIDEKTGDVYYQETSLNSHGRVVAVEYNELGVITFPAGTNGTNDATFSADYKYFINRWSNYNTPYVYSIYNNKGKKIRTLLDNKAMADELAMYQLTPRDTFSFITSEGVRLNGWMIKPTDFDGMKKYPVIMFQYSGPGSQQVLNSWSSGSMGNGGLFDYYLVQQGFIVACVDGRGTGGRGAEFEKCVYQRLGYFEARDQVETALYLDSLPYVDKDNIGIWGWSYGGFNTLMSMSEGRGAFKAGVAVAPPTDWRYYDTVYSERYMRTPQENPEGYNDNPITRAQNLHGKLLICHGAADDNVHPQNTFEYAEALVQADKDFKENYYTNRNHSIYGGNTRNHLLRQITNFFIKNLK